MAVYKCKMCGGTLEITNESVATCEYCGTQQTLPKLGDDRRVTLYDRASHFLRNNEFDKATQIYEQILNEDQTDAEAYWSLVLCRYGIEYVEDPTTRKRVPTVNRAQFTSIFDDDNYRSALLHADSAQRQLYEAEARTINEIQRGILAISQREEPFDVFICYKETDKNGRRTPDSVLANELYHQLTQEGYKVFFSRITLEDKLGVAYEPYIFAALNSAKVMVVLGTREEYFNAVWVKNEWGRYLALIKNGAKKFLIPAYRDMDPYDLPEEFSHLQALDMGRLGFMQDLIRGIKKITRADEPKQTIVKETVVTTTNTNTAPLLRRMFLFLEDAEWDRADDFCEQILNAEPECAEAYLGKLMVELHVRNRENLKDSAEPFDSSNHYRKIIRFADDRLHSELTGYIDHINTRNENARLEKRYQQAIEQQNHANSEESFKAVSALFAAISGYKDAAALAQQCLEQAEGSRLDVLYAAAKNLMTGEEIPDYQEAIKWFENLGNWRDSKEQIEACHQKIKEIEEAREYRRLEGLYQKAHAALQKANSEEAYKAASQLFADIGEFKDSAVLAQQCLEKAEAARLDNLYTAAKSLMTGSKISNYQEAIRRFEELGNWRDSKAQIEICRQKIKEIEALIERQRMERIRQEALRERQRLEKLYQEARKNLEKANSEAQFKAAASLFAAIGGYQDSAALSQQSLEKAEEARKNALYTSAKKLMSGKKPNYEEAIRRFEELGDWRDSAEQIEICRQKIAQAGESKPQSVVRNKKKLFTTVAAILCAVAVLAIVLTMVVIPNSNYRKAVALLDSGNIVEAYDALIALEGYKDSAQKAASIYNAYKLQTAEVGDYVVFGAYEQDNDPSNGTEEIEWLVLDKQDDKLLVISKFGLDCQNYQTSNMDVTWEDCSLRKSLNDDFLNSAFSAEEQARIPTVLEEAHRNPDHDTNPGNAVPDKIFLLSITEANVYFSSDRARQCKATAYAVAQGAWTANTGDCWWWLRSPGGYQNYAANIIYDGSVNGNGDHVGISDHAVRPALWITLGDPAALEDAYNKAVRLMDACSYEEAIAAFEALDGYRDSVQQIFECRYRSAAALAEDGSLLAAEEIYTALGTYKDSADKAIECTRKFYDAELENLTDRSEITKAAIFYYKIGEREKSLALWNTVATRDTLATGDNFTVALKNDGTVVLAGDHNRGLNDVEDWENIIAIAAGDNRTVGLTSDYTVVLTWGSTWGSIDWTDIVAIAASGDIVAGLKADGTVVCTNDLVAENVASWTDIMAITVTRANVLGLQTDGSTVPVSTNPDHKDINAIAANANKRFYLREDGTLFGMGNIRRANVASIHAGSHALVAILRSGDAVLLDGGLAGRNVPDLSKWDALQRKDVVSFSSSDGHAVVLLSDGTVRAYGKNYDGQLNVSGWRDIKMPQQ